MAKLPDRVRNAWENREGPLVFTTVDEKGMPNAIYAGCVKMLDDGRILVVDNYFDKTKHNLGCGTPGSMVFLTNERKSFQVKGSLEYHTEGETYDTMKQWVDPKYPAVGAAVLSIEQAYSGAEKIL